MPSNYPQRIDVFDVPSDNNTSLSSSGDSLRNHYELHRDQGDAVEATQEHAGNSTTNSHNGTSEGGPKLSQANTHQNADTDQSISSIHHTLTKDGNPHPTLRRGSSFGHNHQLPIFEPTSLLSNPSMNPTLAPEAHRFNLEVTPGSSYIKSFNGPEGLEGLSGSGKNFYRVFGSSQTKINLNPQSAYFENGSIYEIAISAKIVSGSPLTNAIKFYIANSSDTSIQEVTFDKPVNSNGFNTYRKYIKFSGATGWHYPKLEINANALPLDIGNIVVRKARNPIRHMEFFTIANPSKTFASGLMYSFVAKFEKGETLPLGSDDFAEAVPATLWNPENTWGGALKINVSGYYSLSMGGFVTYSTYPSFQNSEYHIIESSSSTSFRKRMKGGYGIDDHAPVVFHREWLNEGEYLAPTSYVIGPSHTIVRKRVSLTLEME